MLLAAAVIASRYEPHAFAATLRRAAEYLSATLARPRERREIIRAVQHLAADLDPVVHEDRLHLRNDGPFRTKVRVPPMRRVLRMPGPFVRDADAAGEADAPIDDEQLAMRAVVESLQLVPARLVESAHLDARAFHFCDLAWIHLVAAEPVEQQVHVDAGACALREHFGECLADVAGPVDIAFEADRVLR